MSLSDPFLDPDVAPPGAESEDDDDIVILDERIRPRSPEADFVS